MFVMIDGVEYKVEFQHEQLTKPRDLGFSSLTRAFTKCIISHYNSDYRQVGISWCSANDVFNKEQGRKQALTQAICRFSRPVKTQFWAAYFGRNMPAVMKSSLINQDHLNDQSRTTQRASRFP